MRKAFYGRTRQESFVDEAGSVRKRIRHLPQEQWQVLLVNHHVGFIDWATFEANQSKLDGNTHPVRHEAGGGAVREGAALLQGIAICGNCGRKLRTHYRGKDSAPGYHCAGKTLVEGRGQYCLNVGGLAIDQAVSQAFLNAITPAAIQAVTLAVSQLQAGQDSALAQWRIDVERLRYEADKAHRRYRAVEPENRLVARGLEAEWEARLRELATAECELTRRQQKQALTFSDDQIKQVKSLGSDLSKVWYAETTTSQDRKHLLRTLVEEVTVSVNRQAFLAALTIRWRGDHDGRPAPAALPAERPPHRWRHDGTAGPTRAALPG